MRLAVKRLEVFNTPILGVCRTDLYIAQEVKDGLNMTLKEAMGSQPFLHLV